MKDPDKPSQMVIAQRVRNRIMESLETASSYEVQREYERNVPIEHVPNEVINQWEDRVTPEYFDRFTVPVYSPAEQAAIREFHEFWDGVCNDLPETLPDLEELIGTEPWERLRQAAEKALGVFRVRGRFDEETEAFTP